MNYKQAIKKANKLNKIVTNNDFVTKENNRVANIIVVNHMDGSYFEFCSAAFEKMDNEWMVVFTEHHGVLVYHFEDVKSIRELNSGNLLYQYRE